MPQFINPRKKPEGQGSVTPVTLTGTANSVTLSGSVDTELTTADLDTGAASDVHAVVGLLGSASGGGQLIPGSSTDGLLVNLGANNDVDTELSAAAALSDNFANPTAGGVGAFGMLWDGATWDRQPGNSTDGTLVNLGTNNDVTVTSGNIVADTELPAAAALADNTANPTAPAVGSFGHVWDGATWDRTPGNSTDGLLVNLGSNNDVTVTGSVTADTELTTADLDTGAGTDTRAVVGLVFAASGGATLVSAAAPLPVTATATVAGSVDTELPDAAALADNTANPTTTSVGTFPHWWDGATWDRAPGTAADGLLVNLGANNDVTVTGSVTANAGTNLNTSLLALEAGGNLAAAAASLSVVDDWDESDRAKVNPIAGQAGVQGGAGAVTALTQRVAFATDANAVKITDGTDTADVIDSGTFAGLGVYVLDGSGDPLTSFGGGVQYTEGDADADIVGTAAMWEDGSDTLRAISMAKPLPVQPGTAVAFPVTDNGGSLTVDGTVTVTQGTAANLNATVVGTGTFAAQVTGSVTANAGTNLNTSALALESGGNLAAAAASLSVIDDWDESDRAKVNPIVGQAGVQGGSGTVSALTQRVVLATDVSLPAGTNAIGKLSANSGVDIGDVDVTSVIPGFGATNLGKRQGDSYSTQHVGVAVVGRLEADDSYQVLGMTADSGVHAARVYSTQIATLTNTSSGGNAFTLVGGEDEGDTGRVTAMILAQDVGGKYRFAVNALARKTEFNSFSGTGTTSAYDSSDSPLKSYSLQVTQVGGVTAWDVRLEVSNDGTSFTPVITHTNADLTGTVKFQSDRPANFMRLNCVTKTGGTSLEAYGLGIQ